MPYELTPYSHDGETYYIPGFIQLDESLLEADPEILREALQLLHSLASIPQGQAMYERLHFNMELEGAQTLVISNIHDYASTALLNPHEFFDELEALSSENYFWLNINDEHLRETLIEIETIGAAPLDFRRAMLHELEHLASPFYQARPNIISGLTNMHDSTRDVYRIMVDLTSNEAEREMDARSYLPALQRLYDESPHIYNFYITQLAGSIEQVRGFTETMGVAVDQSVADSQTTDFHYAMRTRGAAPIAMAVLFDEQLTVNVTNFNYALLYGQPTIPIDRGDYVDSCTVAEPLPEIVFSLPDWLNQQMDDSGEALSCDDNGPAISGNLGTYR